MWVRAVGLEEKVILTYAPKGKRRQLTESAITIILAINQ